MAGARLERRVILFRVPRETIGSAVTEKPVLPCTVRGAANREESACASCAASSTRSRSSSPPRFGPLRRSCPPDALPEATSGSDEGADEAGRGLRRSPASRIAFPNSPGTTAQTVSAFPTALFATSCSRRDAASADHRGWQRLAAVPRQRTARLALAATDSLRGDARRRACGLAPDTVGGATSPRPASGSPPRARPQGWPGLVRAERPRSPDRGRCGSRTCRRGRYVR